MSIYVKDAAGNRTKIAGVGLPGPAGKSAYQYAVEGGFTGTEDEFKALMGVRSNPNLLDNWYFVGGGSQQGGGQFPINQRGKTEYSGIGYTIDRWKFNYGGWKLELEDNFVVLTRTENYASGLTQIAENAKALSGREVTLSVLCPAELTGTFSLSLSYNIGESSGGNHIYIGPNAGLYAFTHRLPENFSNLAFSINGYTVGGTIPISGIKLDLGPVQTLAHKEGDTWVLNDPPPNYALELAKCQRYYINSNDSAVNHAIITHNDVIVSGNNTLIKANIQFPSKMVKKPTVRIYGFNNETSKLMSCYGFFNVEGVSVVAHNYGITQEGFALLRITDGSVPDNLFASFNYEADANL